MKNYKGFIFTGVLIAVVIIIYIITNIIKKNQNAKTTPKTSDVSKNNGQIVSTATPHPVTSQTIFPLKRGSTGQAVLLLQKALNVVAAKKNYTFKINGVPKAKIGEDSSFGIETEQAMEQLYGEKYCSKFLANIIAKDTGNPIFVTAINYLF